MPQNQLQHYYSQLNEVRKSELRKAYSDKFEFSRDTFYKKLNGETPLKNLERTFFCSWFNLEIDTLFPLYESAK